MTDKDIIRSRVQAKVERGDFLAQLMGVATRASADVHHDFVEKLSAVGVAVREVLEGEGLVGAIDYRPREFWPSVQGNLYCFIDGGVANIELPSAAPLGIRVGTYLVRPGVEGADREEFDVALALVDELYSEDAWLYGDGFEDVAKLRDAARIIAETSVVLKVWRKHPDISGIFLHGPLVNPAAPYGLGDFPPFSLEAYRRLLHDDHAEPDERERKFVAAYLELLRRLDEEEVPAVGVVERSQGKSAGVLDGCLNHLLARNAIRPRVVDELRKNVRNYQLNDARLFDVVLNPGEYVGPVPVDRQGPENKWPDDWKGSIRAYPAPLTTFLKPSEASEPFRVEALPNAASIHENLDVLYHTSRLLPTYGFPVGLDIVDKYAKVPAWMSRSVRGQHAVVLLKQALRSGDPKVVAFAKRVLAARGRDWLFRPKASE